MEERGNVSAQTFTLSQVMDAMTGACDDILDAASPGEPMRDALNLLVNAAGYYLEHPDDQNLDSAAEDSYGVPYEEVLARLDD